MSFDPYKAPNIPIERKTPRPTQKPGWALGLGIAAMIFWIIPLLGFPIAIVGLVFGIKALSGSKQGMAITATVLCSISLFLSVPNMAGGAYLAATGQHPFLNQMKANAEKAQNIKK